MLSERVQGSLGDMWLYACGLQHSQSRPCKDFYSKKAQKCIRMRITIFKMFLWVGISLDISLKSCLLAQLTLCHKTNFWSYILRYLMVYLPKWKFWIQWSSNCYVEESQKFVSTQPLKAIIHYVQETQFNRQTTRVTITESLHKLLRITTPRITNEKNLTRIEQH